jgi:Ca2+-dependent lipid-binding protein
MFQSMKIIVNVIKARNICAKDANGYSDPQVVVEINNLTVGETNVIKKSLDPVWDYSVT